MNYFRFRLRFDTPVHFGTPDSALSLYDSGDHFRGDTLFSALCHMALQGNGVEGLEELLALTRAGKLLLSDAMPWAGEDYYLPKPCQAAQASGELPPEKRKALKKLCWIPPGRMEEYCQCLKTGTLFEAPPLKLGVSSEVTKVTVPDRGDGVPYPLGVFRFREDRGLYFLAGLEDENVLPRLTQWVELLGLTGIGGRVSTGYGKFTVTEVAEVTSLWPSLSRREGPLLLLTTSLPREEELDAALAGAGFQLVRRGGFVASDGYAPTPRKKKTQYFLAAGAVVRAPFSGDLYGVGTGGGHPVYRYGKPLFWEVPL